MPLLRTLFVVRQFWKARLLSFQVDGVFAQVGARVVPKVKDAFAAIPYANVANLRHMWMPLAAARQLPGADQPVDLSRRHISQPTRPRRSPFSVLRLEKKKSLIAAT